MAVDLIYDVDWSTTILCNCHLTFGGSFQWPDYILELWMAEYLRRSERRPTKMSENWLLHL